jgi:hypothetical protein
MTHTKITPQDQPLTQGHWVMRLRMPAAWLPQNYRMV